MLNAVCDTNIPKFSLSGVPIISSDGGDSYAVLNYLGEGSFGTVVMCQNLKTKEDVAIKVVDPDMVDNTHEEVPFPTKVCSQHSAPSTRGLVYGCPP